MSFLLGWVLIVFGMALLYTVSHKQLEKFKKSRFAAFAKFVKSIRIVAFFLFFCAASCFVYHYGDSVGFVSWWLFATPLTFFIILYVNDLKDKNIKIKPKR